MSASEITEINTRLKNIEVDVKKLNKQMTKVVGLLEASSEAVATGGGVKMDEQMAVVLGQMRDALGEIIANTNSTVVSAERSTSVKAATAAKASGVTAGKGRINNVNSFFAAFPNECYKVLTENHTQAEITSEMEKDLADCGFVDGKFENIEANKSKLTTFSKTYFARKLCAERPGYLNFYKEISEMRKAHNESLTALPDEHSAAKTASAMETSSSKTESKKTKAEPKETKKKPTKKKGKVTTKKKKEEEKKDEDDSDAAIESEEE